MLLWHMGSSSLTRDRTQAPCFGSAAVFTTGKSQTMFFLVCFLMCVCILTNLCPTLCDSMDCTWNGLPFPSPGDFLDPGTEPLSPSSPASQADSLPLSQLPFTILRKWRESCSLVPDSSWPHRLYSPWNSPGQNTGVGNLSLLQGIFPTQGSNPGLPNCRWILYQLGHEGSPYQNHTKEAFVYP